MAQNEGLSQASRAASEDSVSEGDKLWWQENGDLVHAALTDLLNEEANEADVPYNADDVKEVMSPNEENETTKPSPPSQPSSSSAVTLSVAVTLDIELADSESSNPTSRRAILPWFCVTDFSRMLWCEQQYAFRNKYGDDPDVLRQMGATVNTEQRVAKAAGNDRHMELELEVHDIVSYPTTSRIDVWAVRFLNVIQTLREILVAGKSREIPVFGFIHHIESKKDVLVTGFIDEIERDSSLAVFVLSDTKTRSRSTLPGKSQSETSKLQLMMYHLLLEKMLRREVEWARVLTFLGLDGSEKLSDDLALMFSEHDGLEGSLGNSTDAMTLNSVLRVVDATLAVFSCKPGQEIISPTLFLNYEKQGSRKHMGTVSFTYDNNWLNSKVQSMLDFGLGLRDAKGVQDIEEAGLKCGSCEYAPICEWREEMCRREIQRMQETSRKRKRGES